MCCFGMKKEAWKIRGREAWNTHILLLSSGVRGTFVEVRPFVHQWIDASRNPQGRPRQNGGFQWTGAQKFTLCFRVLLFFFLFCFVLFFVQNVVVRKKPHKTFVSDPRRNHEQVWMGTERQPLGVQLEGHIQMVRLVEGQPGSCCFLSHCLEWMCLGCFWSVLGTATRRLVFLFREKTSGILANTWDLFTEKEWELLRTSNALMMHSLKSLDPNVRPIRQR